MGDMAVMTQHNALSRAGSFDLGPQSGALHVAHFSGVMYLQRHVLTAADLACACAKHIDDVVSASEVHDGQWLSVYV